MCIRDSYYSSLGLAVPIEERDLLVTTGGSEAILFTLLAICDPGDEVITPCLLYTSTRAIATFPSAWSQPDADTPIVR